MIDGTQSKEATTREAVADIFTMDGPAEEIDAAILDGIIAQGFSERIAREILATAHLRAGLED